MALENLVDGMTGLQLANTIKNNFDKVLDAESAENKAENAGKSIKTDYDATRYIELQLADGTPVKMKMDVFCQAIAPVVAGLFQLKSESQDIDNISDVFCFTRVRPSTSTSANELPFAVWFFLIQFVFPGYNIMQIAIAATVPEIKIRTKWNNVWGEWITILLS